MRERIFLYLAHGCRLLLGPGCGSRLLLSGWLLAGICRLGLAARGWRYVIAVKGTTSARPHDAVPAAWPYGGLGRPSVPRYRSAPVSLRQLAIAHADTVQPVTWRQGTRATTGNPTAAMTSCFAAIRVRPANRDIPRADDGCPRTTSAVGWRTT